MSSSIKFRMHMGCGEPLRSRWWVAQPVHSLSLEKKGVQRGRLQKRRAAQRQEAECKT